MKEGNWTIDELDNMFPFEREIYVNLLLNKFKETKDNV